jgi:hypothetical protein
MELERFAAAVRRRWYLIGALVALGAAMGLLGEAGRTDRFLAEASVSIVSDRNVYGSEQVLDRIVVNEMEFVSSLDLRTAVVDTIGVAGINPAEDMTIAQRTDADVVNLRVNSPEEGAAVAAANFWAQSWLAESMERKTAAIDELLIETEASLVSAQAALAASDATVTRLLGPGTRFTTITDLFASDLDLAAEQQLLNSEVRRIRATITDLQFTRSKISPFSIVSRAESPATPLRSGNGLGPVHGAIIGLGIALALVMVLERTRLSARSAQAISDTVWPETTSRSSAARVERIAQELLRTLPVGQLPLVAFSGTGVESHTSLHTELAANFAARGFDVTVLTDDPVPADAGYVTLARDRLNDIVDLSTRDTSDLANSMVFAQLSDLWFQRSVVHDSSVVVLVHLDIGVDGEHEAATTISRARVLSPSVLTVAA